MAARNDSADVARLLLEIRNEDVDATDVDAWTPLHHAATGNHADVANLLIDEYGADVHAVEKSGATPLHVSCLSNSAEVARLLLNKDSDVLARTNDSMMTPLHVAARADSVDTARLLVRRNRATLEAKADHDLTPLHRAAQFNSIGIARLLIAENHVDIHTKDVDGNTAIDWVYLRNSTSVGRLLINKGANTRNIADPVWYLEHTNSVDYIGIDGTSEFRDQFVRALHNAHMVNDLSIHRSFRPAKNGYRYGWYIRLSSNAASAGDIDDALAMEATRTPRSGLKWHIDENDSALTQLLEGHSASVVAKRLGRSTGAIESRFSERRVADEHDAHTQIVGAELNEQSIGENILTGASRNLNKDGNGNVLVADEILAVPDDKSSKISEIEKELKKLREDLEQSEAQKIQLGQIHYRKVEDLEQQHEEQYDRLKQQLEEEKNQLDLEREQLTDEILDDLADREAKKLRLDTEEMNQYAIELHEEQKDDLPDLQADLPRAKITKDQIRANYANVNFVHTTLERLAGRNQFRDTAPVLSLVDQLNQGLNLGFKRFTATGTAWNEYVGPSGSSQIATGELEKCRLYVRFRKQSKSVDVIVDWKSNQDTCCTEFMKKNK